MTLTEYLNYVDKDVKSKSKYQARFSKIKGSISSKWYAVKETGNIIITIQIPSEKAKHIYYNVFLEFPDTNRSETAKKLLTSEMKVFSNCPSFVFMNAKYFEEKGFLIEWAKSLYDPKVFEETDEVTEANKENTLQKEAKDVKCEKSLYFAALYIKSMSVITILNNMNRAMTIRNVEMLTKTIRDSNAMLKKRVNSTKKSPIDKLFNKPNKSKSQNTAKATSPVKKVKATSPVKKVSKIKHI